MFIAGRTGRFKRDVKLCVKRGYDMALLNTAVKILIEKGVLPNKYKSHPLHGSYDGYMECHIESDWLLIWLQDNITTTDGFEGTITFVRTGTHSDLF
ncbi:MAG: type II toxin-antitoxin system YafQ family toxin [Bacteroidales bacterium]|nr:type II toxin-antitoxin system YafQ family toxin [Bacteroidales bacterium]